MNAPRPGTDAQDPGIATNVSRPVGLVVVGYYLPVFRAGGIHSCVANIVAHLHRDFQFMIVTRDWDLCDTEAYAEIRPSEWQRVGHALVYYVPSGRGAAERVRRVVSETPHDIIYFNSFFEPLVVRTLLSRRIGRAPHMPALLAPHGEFAWPSFRQKRAKKRLFIGLARAVGLYDVTWHASNEVEADDIRRTMGRSADRVHVAHQLPPTAEVELDDRRGPSAFRRNGEVRAFFFSRISPEKNLHVALEILRRVTVDVVFDIIGPIENAAYWAECQALISRLPGHVQARSVGTVKPADLLQTLAQYDVMLFPTGGEGYGQVIAEALIVGTQVLGSTETPWRNLETLGLGWDMSLENLDRYASVIDEIGASTEDARSRRRADVRSSMKRFLSESRAIDDVRRLLNDVIESGRDEAALKNRKDGA